MIQEILIDNILSVPRPHTDSGDVIRAMEKVTVDIVDKRKKVWERVLGRRAVSEIYSDYFSLEEEKLYSCADTYANCKADSSWEQLVQELYECSELVAAKEAKAFLQQKGGWYMDAVSPLILITACVLLSMCHYSDIVSYPSITVNP